MKCQDAEKWILLQDSGEMPEKQAQPLAAHLHDCEPCRKFQFTLLESQNNFQSLEEPSAVAIQNVLREARQNAPEAKRPTLWIMKPAFAAAAAVIIGLGLFFSNFAPNKVGMELVMSETQLLSAEEQVSSVTYGGLSDDDLAFNFLMTYEEG